MKSIKPKTVPGLSIVKGFVCVYCVLISLIWGHSFLIAREFSQDSIADSSTNAKKTAPKSPRGAVIRAAVFPGWGQWYNGKKFKAVLAFGTEVGFLSASIWHNQRVVTRLGDEYTEDYKKEYREFHLNMRNQYIWYLAGAILYAMADAYVDAHLHEFDESPDLAFLKRHISFDILNDHCFVVTYKFNL